MDNIFETLVNLGCKIDFWAYGHFHIGYSDLISNNGYHTLWLALNDRFDYKAPLTARSMALYELEQSKKKKKKNTWSQMVFDSFSSVSSMTTDTTIAGDIAVGGGRAYEEIARQVNDEIMQDVLNALENEDVAVEAPF